MHRFIDGEDRMQQALLPHSLEDYVGEENPVRVIEVFIDELDLAALGFSGMTPTATGRPAYHPSIASRKPRAPIDQTVSTVTGGKHAASLTSHDAFFHGLGRLEPFRRDRRAVAEGWNIRRSSRVSEVA